MADQRIYALFQDVADAERAIGALHDHGVPRDHIGVLARRAAEQDEAGRVRTDYTRVSDSQGAGLGEPQVAYEAQPNALPAASSLDAARPAGTADTPLNVETVGKEGLTTTTPQDAAAGAAVGSGVGLVAGLLAAAAALAIPGVGFVLAGGALAAALGGAAATAAAGAVAGGAVGYLRDMGMPEHAAQHVADRVHEGDYLVTVVADAAQYDEIKQLLIKYNAVGVDINVASAGLTTPAQEVREVSGAHVFPDDAPTFSPASLSPEGVIVTASDSAPPPAPAPAPVVGRTPDERLALADAEREARLAHDPPAQDSARAAERDTHDTLP